MKKGNVNKIAYFLLPLLALTSSSCAERIRVFSDQERNRYTEESVLILDVTATGVEMIKRDMIINAIEKHADIGYAVHFEVNEILKMSKDEIAEKTFTVAVHSPTLTFGIPPWGNTKNKRYRLYFKFIKTAPSDGYVLIGTEWLQAKNK